MAVCMRSGAVVPFQLSSSLTLLRPVAPAQSTLAWSQLDKYWQILLLPRSSFISHQSPDTSHRMNYDPRTRMRLGWSHSSPRDACWMDNSVNQWMEPFPEPPENSPWALSIGQLSPEPQPRAPSEERLSCSCLSHPFHLSSPTNMATFLCLRPAPTTQSRQFGVSAAPPVGMLLLQP